MAHARNTARLSWPRSPSKSQRKAQRGPERSRASDFFNVPLMTPIEEILTFNRNGKLWTSPKELVDKLHIFLPSTKNDLIRAVLVSQYKIARAKRRLSWMKEFRANVALHQSKTWMKKHINFWPPLRRVQPSTVTSRSFNRGIKSQTNHLQPMFFKQVRNVKHRTPEVVQGTGIIKEDLHVNTIETIVISDEEESCNEVGEAREPWSRTPIHHQRKTYGQRLEKIKSQPSVANGYLRHHVTRKRKSSRERSPLQRQGKGRKRIRQCALQSCKGMFRNARRHAMSRHLPFPFHKDQILDQSLNDKRLELIQFIKYSLLGDNSSFEDLVSWVNEQNAFSANNFVPDSDVAWLSSVCHQRNLKVPKRFTFVPVNSEALLFHWRVILILLNGLTEEERQKFKLEEISEVEDYEEEFQVVDSVGFDETPSDETQPQSESGFLKTFDSHFHKTQPSSESHSLVTFDSNFHETQPSSESLPLETLNSNINETQPSGESPSLETFDSHYHETQPSSKSRSLETLDSKFNETQPSSESPSLETFVSNLDETQLSSESPSLETFDSHCHETKPSSESRSLETLDSYFNETQPSSESQSRETFDSHFHETQPSSESQCLEAFDSHFIADCLSKTLFGNPRDAIAHLIKGNVGCSPHINVTVVGGVMVFCDPETFPETLPSVNGFGSAVGVHPKKCHLLTEERFQVITDFLRTPDIVALGKTGIDRSDPESSWDLQEKTMVRLLQFSMPVRPVILHMRDRLDQHSGEVSAKCLQIMKANAAPTQRIHLHSFGGTVEQVVGWLEAFPYCYFGFSEKVTSFDMYQVAALQRIPDNRLLLETDGPSSQEASANASAPVFLGDIGEVISRHRGTSLAHIMQLTTQNGRRLYSL